MGNYIIRKLLTIIPMLLVITFLIFLGVELMPGDVLDFMIPMDELSRMTEAEVVAVRESLGLNKPFIVRFFIWLGGILRGDLGYSMQNNVPVTKLLSNTLPATLELSFAALIISTIIGSILGVLSAVKKGSIGDNIMSVAGMIGVAIPQFLFGLICIILFALKLEWFPVGGRMMPGKEAFFQRIQYLIMPACVLGLSMTAGVMRYSRASMLDSLNKDFVKTARSKGIPEWRVNLVHGLRVAYTPVVVLVGFRLPMLVGGAIVIEEIFQWPGVGILFTNAVRTQDTAVIMSVGLFFVVLVLLSSLLVDVLTAALDPRVQLS
ncbi:MAG: ABC transporter permease [Clostridia bacterium]